ncbi:MAG: hypothetical protein ACM3JG_08105, partial [Thiohalocapsa sp.]
ATVAHHHGPPYWKRPPICPGKRIGIGAYSMRLKDSSYRPPLQLAAAMSSRPTDRCGMRSVLRHPVGIMRGWWVRVFVVLLALALIGGNNAHLEAHPVIASDHDCAGAAAQPHESSADSAAKRAGCARCCDCLGCVSSMNLSPPLGAIDVRFPVEAIRFAASASFRPGRSLLPDPPPPRPGALS